MRFSCRVMLGTKLRRTYHGRFGAIPQQMIPERVNKAKREARPERRSKVARHQGNLLLQTSKGTRNHPAKTRVTETHNRPQKLAAICQPSVPSAKVHWYVDGHEKTQIACNPSDRNDEGQANRTVEFR